MVARIGNDWQGLVGNGRDVIGEVRLGPLKKHCYQTNRIKLERK